MCIEREEEVKKFKDLAQKEIAYCYNCQPSDGGKCFWILGIESNLDELLFSLEVTEELHEDVSEDLYCLNCGTSINLGDEIGLYTQAEKALIEKIDKWEKFYKKDLDDFSKFIQKYPYLGAKHKMGKKIVSAIKQTRKSSFKDREWYRGIAVCNDEKLKKEDFLPPDPAKRDIPEGRYNHHGQSHWYLADSEEGATIECSKGKDGQFTWLQKIKINSLDKILDLSKYEDNGDDINIPLVIAGIIYSGTLEKRILHNSSWKPEYFVPRFIADVAKECGFNSILFTNSQHFHKNLVIFNISGLKYEFIDKSFDFKILPLPGVLFEINEIDLEI